MIACTADGAAPNRKFFEMHREGNTGEVMYKTANVYSSDVKWRKSDVRPFKNVTDPWILVSYDYHRVILSNH